MNQKASRHLPRWKKLLFSVLLLLGVIGVLEVSAIWYLKLFRGYDGVHLLQYEFDPYKNILPTRNYVDTRGIRHNSQGFRRSTEVLVKKPEKTYRIFLMGASTAYGLGGLWPHLQREYAVIDNSKTIDAFLERSLNEAFPDLNLEVVNAAITSTWTHHHLIYLNQTILRFDPDMLIFIDGFNDFYFWNKGHDQFADYAYDEHSRILMGEPTLHSLAYVNLWWLFRKSALVHVTFRTLRELKRSLQSRPAAPPIDVKTSMRGFKYVFRNNALKMIQRTAMILREEDVRAVFVLQPMLILDRGRTLMPDIERKLFEFNVQSWQPNYEAFIHRAVEFVRQEENQVVQRYGGQFIDATGIYRQAQGQIFTDYAHLTPNGNRLLADHIAARIIPMIRDNIVDR